MKPAQAHPRYEPEATSPRATSPRESHEIAKSEDMLAWPSHVVNNVRVTKKINRIGGNFEGSHEIEEMSSKNKSVLS